MKTIKQPECSGKGKARVDIRWMIRRDMPEVLNIELLNFEFPWDEDGFVRCLRQRNCIGMVAECRDTSSIRGFMIYELHRDRLHLLNIAVQPTWQKWGVGSGMVQKLIGKLSPVRRNRIMVEVRETNLSGLLFLKAMGFRATAILKSHYEETNEDAICMQYTLQSK